MMMLIVVMLKNAKQPVDRSVAATKLNMHAYLGNLYLDLF